MPSLKSILKGDGFNVGMDVIPGFADVPKHYVEPDNLYTLRNKANYESLDFIVSNDLVFATKFHRILLKEWMNFCRVGGTVCIIFKQTQGKNLPFLISEMFELFQNNVEIDWELSGEHTVVYAKKLKPVLAPGDSIERWTFGIIANGKRDGNVDGIIRSIISQNIPNYEIIVCGTYANANKMPIIYIPFSEKDERGWITKKKNLIAKHAKHENIVIVHDRIIFEPSWYAGMKKYGNYFDALSCVQTLEGTAVRAGDWVTMGAKYDPALSTYDSCTGDMDYRDWDENAYIVGSLCILKKSVWKNAPWNEHLFWTESEDGELSWRFFRQGIVIRFNPYSKCTALSWQHGRSPQYEFNSRRRGNLLPAYLGIYKVMKESAIRHFPAGVLEAYKWLEVTFPPVFVLRQRLSKHVVKEFMVVERRINDLRVGDEVAGNNGKKFTVSSIGLYSGRVLGITLKGADGAVKNFGVKACGKKFLAFSFDYKIQQG